MPPAGIALGLLGAVSFGAGDVAGATVTKRSGALIAVAGAHLIGLVAVIGAVAVLRPPVPDLGAIGIGLLAGLFGAAGLAALYRGMALGSMGLVSALGGAGSLALPLAASAALGATITPIQLTGVVATAAAGAAASGATRREIGRGGLLLAGAAAATLGAWYVLIDLASRAGDPLWALATSRGASALAASLVTIAMLVVRRRGPGALPMRLIVTAGVFDVGGNALYVASRGFIPVGLAAALSGLYPIVTVLIARVLLGERLSVAARIGVGLALLGVVLISFG
jgi:drug/metabolite transporter (DMT)-like permease